MLNRMRQHGRADIIGATLTIAGPGGLVSLDVFGRVTELARKVGDSEQERVLEDYEMEDAK